MEEEKVLLMVPKCAKQKMLSGRSEFYNLIITEKRIIGAKTGGTFFATRGPIGMVAEKAAKDKQDVDKFSGKDLEEIVSSDKNNWAIPFAAFDEIKVTKQMGPGGQGFVRFKLNKEGKKLDSHSSVPISLTFDKQYLSNLQETLRSLASRIVKT